MYLVDDSGHRYELENIETFRCTESHSIILFFKVNQLLNKKDIRRVEKELGLKTGMNCVVLDGRIKEVLAVCTPPIK